MKFRGYKLVIIATLLGVCFEMNQVKEAATQKNEESVEMNGYHVYRSNRYVDGDIDLTSISDRRFSPKMMQPRTLYEEKSLYVPFQTQETTYWCGPAATSMALNTIGYETTQSQMADLLGTTENGTGAGAGVANAMNAIAEGSKYTFYWEWHQPWDVSTIQGKIVNAISYGNPVVVNTAESPGDCYINGHDTGSPLYHFGVVSAFYNYGETVTYEDPAYGRFEGFWQTQTIGVEKISKAAGGRGYVW